MPNGDIYGVSVLCGMNSNQTMGVLFPPTVSILFLAQIVTLIAGGLWLLWKDWKNFPYITMSIEDARNAFVRPKTSEKDIFDYCEELESEGKTEVLVAPMFPFIVPIAAVLLPVLFLGPFPFMFGN